MGVVDALVLGTLAISFILGLIRGFLSQITGLVGLLGGGYLAWRYGAAVREAILDPYLRTDYNREIAFGLLLFGTLLVVALIGWLLRKLFAQLKVGAYDRLMGGVFGTVKAGLICAGVLLGIVTFATDGGEIERAISTSRAGPLLWQGMNRVAAVLPRAVRTDVRAFLERNPLPAPEKPEIE